MILPAGELSRMITVLDEMTNALLVEVATPGAPDRNGDPGASTAVWTGSAECYLERVDHQALSGGQQVTVRADTLTILDGKVPAAIVSGPDWKATILTVEDRRDATPVTRVFNVTGAEHVAFNLLDSTRLELGEITT